MKNILCSFILLFSLSTYGQSIIKGKITDTHGEALPGANIYFEGTFDGTSSNVDGTFILKTDLKGEYVLLIEFLGFESVRKTMILDGSEIIINIILKEKFNKLKAVTITAGTFEAGDKKKSVVLGPVDMVTTAGAMGDVYGALKMLPGANANPESGKLFVKGGHSDESQTYINGTLVHSPYSETVPNTSTRGRFNPFIFSGTVFSTGGYSAEYGQALSSVLLLETKDLPLEDELNISVLSVGADFGGTKLWKDGGITVTGKYQHLGPYMNLFKQNFDWIEHPKSAGAEISLHQKTKNARFKLYVNYGDSDLALNQPDPIDVNTPKVYDLEDDNFFMNASWKRIMSEKLFLRSGLSYTVNNNNIDIEGDKIEEKLNGLHYKSVLNYHINPKFLLKSGFEFNITDYDFSFKDANIGFKSDYIDHLTSFFTETEIYASNAFVLRLGTRLEYSGLFEQYRLSPRISTAYKFDDFSTLSLSWGTFYQRPSDDIVIYSRDLRSERSDHYTLGFQYVKNERALRFDAYYKNYDDLVTYDAATFFLPDSYDNSGYGSAKGIDIFWRDKKSLKNAEYWISYSYLDTDRMYRNYPISTTPYYASKHNLSVVFKYWFSYLRSLAGLSFRYASPRAYNDPNESEFNSGRTIPYKTIDLNWSFLYRSYKF